MRKIKVVEEQVDDVSKRLSKCRDYIVDLNVNQANQATLNKKMAREMKSLKRALFWSAFLIGGLSICVLDLQKQVNTIASNVVKNEVSKG